MDRVDAMKKLQGWTDTSVLHFRNLGVFGEQILLSIRYGSLERRATNRCRRQLGAVLAAGDPGLHPRLPLGHRRRPDGGECRRQRRRDLAVGPAAQAAGRRRRSALRRSRCSTSPPRSISGCGTRARRSLPGTRSRSGGRRPWREPPDAEAVAGELAQPSGLRGGDAAAVDAAPVLGSVPRARRRAGRHPVRRRPVSDRALGRGAGIGLGVPVGTFAHHDVGRAGAGDRSPGARPAAADRRHRRLLPELRRAGADPGLRRAGAAGRRLARHRRHAGARHPGRRRRPSRTPTAAAAADRCAGTACSGRTSSSAARWQRASVRRSPPSPAAAR